VVLRARGAMSSSLSSTTSSYIDRLVNSQRIHIITTAAVTAVVVAGGIFGVQKFTKRRRIERIKAEIPDSSSELVCSKLYERLNPICSLKTNVNLRVATD
jgi:hypothetical protein